MIMHQTQSSPLFRMVWMWRSFAFPLSNKLGKMRPCLRKESTLPPSFISSKKDIGSAITKTQRIYLIFAGRWMNRKTLI